MVLEFLISPWKAEADPWKLFFIGAIYSSAGLLLSMRIFPDHAGIAMVFLTAIASLYLVQQILNLEAKKDREIEGEISILRQHAKALSAFIFLFLGFVFSFVFWYVALPGDVTHSVYGIQEQTISCINSPGIQGCATGDGFFAKIIKNNLVVFSLTLLIALLYGAGAVFVLAWNAAIVGTAVGIFIRNSLSSAAEGLGIASLASYFGIFSAGLLRYLSHGIFEMLAYFMAAFAGGLMSFTIAKYGFNSSEFRKVAFDAFNVVSLGLGFLLMAAALEAFVTPVFF